ATAGPSTMTGRIGSAVDRGICTSTPDEMADVKTCVGLPRPAANPCRVSGRGLVASAGTRSCFFGGSTFFSGVAGRTGADATGFSTGRGAGGGGTGTAETGAFTTSGLIAGRSIFGAGGAAGVGGIGAATGGVTGRCAV